MWRRWRSWRPRDNNNVEFGMRNAEWQCECRLANDPSLQFRIPHSAFRIRGGAVKYFVKIASQTIEVDVDGDRVLVGGEPVDAHLAPLAGTPLYHLLLAGASWTVAAQPLEGDGRWAMGVVGERVEVAVQDERTRAAGGGGGTRGGPGGGGAGGGGGPVAGVGGRRGGVGAGGGQGGGGVGGGGAGENG